VRLAAMTPGAALTRMSAESLNRPLNLCRVAVEVAKFAPIEVLALCNESEDRIIRPPNAILQGRNVNVQNGKDEIVSAQCRFTGEKRINL
jgi:hypothetical protein